MRPGIAPEDDPADDVEPTREKWEAYEASRTAPQPEARPVRLIELRAENFKRLTAVAIRPTGAVTPITGKNGAGKTSVLDAITAALGGGSHAPELPIRKGEERAKVVLDLEDIVVTRKWTAKGSTLEVATKEGAAYKSPQAVLDKLVGTLSFDPLDFARMKPQEQANALAKVAAFDLDQHRAMRQMLFNDRATAKKAAANLRAQAEGTPPPPADLPAEEIPVAAILEEMTAAEHAKTARASADREHVIAKTNRTAIQRRIEELRGELAEAEGQLVHAEEAVRATAAALDQTPPAPDVEAIKARGRAAEKTNELVRAARARALKLSDAAKLEAEAKSFTTRIEAMDAEIPTRLANCALPVPGLSIGETGVTVNGIPFGQCSGAERLRVSVAIGLALNPKLKLMLIRDGSLLDSDGMKLLADLAEAAGAQVLIERVSDGDGVGVRIVDGTTEDALPAAA